MIPVLVFAIYLTCNNIWTDFIDYTILGVQKFSNSKSYFGLLQSSDFTTRILAYLAPAIFVAIFVIYIVSIFNKELREKEWLNKMQLLLVYSVASVVVIYPIADRVHFSIGTICVFLTGIYLVYNLILYVKSKITSKKVIYGVKMFLKAITVLLFILYILHAILVLIGFKMAINGQKQLEHFNGIYTDEGLYNRISIVDEYILKKEKEGKKVYILDTTAPMFNIPINRYYKNYDMLNLGNLGSRAEEGIIEDIKSKDNILMLVLKNEYSRNWQFPRKIEQYVMQNYNYLEEIELYNVYIK